jgi:hypothetical protein
MKKIFSKIGKKEGNVIVVVALGIVVLAAFVALAIDIGYMMVVRNELQNVADAAALAGARYIGNTYEGLTYAQQQTYTFVRNDIVTPTKAIALQNKAGELNISILDSDIEIGKWNSQSKTLYDIGDMHNASAVRVRARRDATGNGPINTFIARVIGINTAEVSSTAVASLSGESTAAEGGLPVPIAISQIIASNPNWCSSSIVMHPTKDSCAGWHTFLNKTHSAAQLREILQDLLPPGMRDKQYQNDPTFISPSVTTYSTSFNLTGGDLSTNFPDFFALFTYMKDLDGDGDNSMWTTAVAIYKEESSSCGNPQGDIPIVGFSTIQIKDVIVGGDHQIVLYPTCGLFDQGRSGGSDYGTFGSIPGLVQ